MLFGGGRCALLNLLRMTMVMMRGMPVGLLDKAGDDVYDRLLLAARL